MKPNRSLIPSRWNLVATLAILAILFGAFLVPDLSAQTLMLQYGFEDTGTTTVDSQAGVTMNLVNSANAATDLHGAVGTGVAGQGKALDLTAGAIGGLGPVAAVVNSSAITFGTITNFTITMWVKPTVAMSGNPRFIVLGANGTTDDSTGIGLEANGSATPCQAGLNGTKPAGEAGHRACLINNGHIQQKE